MRDPIAPAVARHPHARVVIRTDGAGALESIVSADEHEADPKLSLAIDLGAAALAQAGEALGFGRLRTALLVFEGATVAIGRDDEGRNVIVVGEPSAVPGLVLSHLHTTLAATRASRTEP